MRNITFNKTEMFKIKHHLLLSRLGVESSTGNVRLKTATKEVFPDRVAPGLLPHIPSRDEYVILARALVDEWHETRGVPAPVVASFKANRDDLTIDPDYPSVSPPAGWSAVRFHRLVLAPPPFKDTKEETLSLNLRRGHYISMQVTGTTLPDKFYYKESELPVSVLKVPEGDWIRKLIFKHAAHPENLGESVFTRLHNMIQILRILTILKYSGYPATTDHPSGETTPEWVSQLHIPSLGYLSLHFPEMIPHLPPGVFRKVHAGLTDGANTPVKWRISSATPPPPPLLREALRYINTVGGIPTPAGEPPK